MIAEPTQTFPEPPAQPVVRIEHAAHHQLADCARLVQTLLVTGLRLQSVAIASDLAHAQGGLRGLPVSMNTVRYTGPGFQSLTVATIAGSDGQLCSLTVVGLPTPESGLPVLGMDLIALRGSLSLVAIDLAPTVQSIWQQSCATILQALHEQTRTGLVPRKRPDFTADVFSPLALIAGARAGQESGLVPALHEFLRSTVGLWQQSSVALATAGQSSASHQSSTAQRAIERWLAAERRNRREHNALADIFGAAFAARYLHSFLFAPTTAVEMVAPEGILHER